MLGYKSEVFLSGLSRDILNKMTTQLVITEIRDIHITIILFAVDIDALFNGHYLFHVLCGSVCICLVTDCTCMFDKVVAYMNNKTFKKCADKAIMGDSFVF